MSTVNPYEPPRCIEPEMPPDTSNRRHAIFYLRSLIVILLAPAIYNYYAFDMNAIAGARIQSPIYAVYRIINVGGIIIAAAGIWFFALPILERLSGAIRRLFAKNADETAWTNTLYSSLQHAMYLSIGGSILWAIWVFAYYSLHADFATTSYAIGIPAHLLGACWYVPLFVRWYRLKKSAAYA